MNDPYPTNAQLYAEADANRLLAEQAAATAAFRHIVRAAIAAIDALHFPLGSPAAGFEIDDITGTMMDFLAPTDPQYLQDVANDRALDAQEAA
jgi:hypothetical protein